MSANLKALVMRALVNYKGDDLERAEHAFRNFTVEQLRQNYGASGRTCQEILDGYRAQRRSVLDAMAWVESMPEQTK